MSYDLLFQTTGGPPLTRDRWRAYAASMPLTRWVDEERLFYENVETGVYCAFDYRDPGPDGDARDTALAFNLNYARPSFFGLETMPLVERVCADLDLLVVDPQADGNPGPKVARADELLATWNDGNFMTAQQVAAYAAQGALTGQNAVSYLPPERGLAFWSYRRRQARIKHHFAGRAEAALILATPKGQKEAVRLLAWQPDDAAWLIPPCDLVRIVVRMSLFGAFAKDVGMVVPRVEALAALAGLTHPLPGDEDVLVVDADQMPAATRKIRSLGGRPFGDYERVRPDHCIEVPLN